uniref:RING-type E3 ubiquitin transferase n=1 Tax=Leersia perrieri TaxID=77586 RepID=A0A0D9WFL1_9ORYZ
MSTSSSLNSGPAPATVDPSKHWTRHGPVLTACLVSINLLMVLLIFFYFWRFFSGKRGGPPTSSSTAGDDDDEEAASSADTSRRASWRGWPAGKREEEEEDIASSLPVSVYNSASVDGKAAECAVCIVELRDGDTARLLPRCGHRFHADCVAAWLRLHSTCPLCRAAVLAPASKDDTKDAAAEVADEEACPV